MSKSVYLDAFQEVFVLGMRNWIKFRNFAQILRLTFIIYSE